MTEEYGHAIRQISYNVGLHNFAGLSGISATKASGRSSPVCDDCAGSRGRAGYVARNAVRHACRISVAQNSVRFLRRRMSMTNSSRTVFVVLVECGSWPM
jgi:hypothetical protein